MIRVCHVSFPDHDNSYQQVDLMSLWLNGSPNHVTFLPEGECGEWQTRLAVYDIHYYEISQIIIPCLKVCLVRG
jgi:hypothetical protein